MRSIEPFDSNTVEVDGICFATFMPERVLKIPKQNGDRIPLQLGINITNNTSIPRYFSFLFSFTPEIKTPDGQIRGSDYSTDRLLKPLVSDFLLAKPSETVTFSLNAKLYWTKLSIKDRCETLVIFIPFRDGYFMFDFLKPGIYQMRFTYEEYSSMVEDTYQRWIEPSILQSLWIGKIATPFVEFRLVES